MLPILLKRFVSPVPLDLNMPLVPARGAGVANAVGNACAASTAVPACVAGVSQGVGITNATGTACAAGVAEPVRTTGVVPSVDSNNANGVACAAGATVPASAPSVLLEV
jgi:hypothetical protein